MSKNQKLTKENLLESTPESSEADEPVVVHKKSSKDVSSKTQQKGHVKVAEAPAKASKEDGKKKDKKEVPRKDSGHSHSHKDESQKPPVPLAPKHEDKQFKKDKKAKEEEQVAPKKAKQEETKLGKRDAPSKPVTQVKAAPKKDTQVREISSDSSEESEEEKPVKKAPKKEEKPVKKEEKVVKKEAKKSESSASNSKKVSFHESDVQVDKNKKVKPSAPVQAQPKKDDSKLNKMKAALKKQESSESEEEMEVEDNESEESEMEVEEEAPKARKASAEKSAPRKASAEKVTAPRKASAEKVVAPRKASAEKAQASNGFQNGQNKPAFAQNNAGNSRYGPTFEVIVCGLPFTSSEQDIRSHFGDIHDINSVKIMMGQDGRPRGKAFLKFGCEDSMNTALGLNGSNLGGRDIIVELTDNMKGGRQDGGQPGQGSFQGGNRGGFQGGAQGGFQNRNAGSGPGEHAPENTNVMVKNLAFSVDEEKLKSVFSGCGTIKAVRVCKKEDGSSRGFGFVDFTSIDSAKNALKKANEKIDGRNIDVQFSLPRDKSAPRQGGFGGGQGSFGGRPGGFGGRPAGFGDAKKGNLTQFQGEAVDLD